MVRALISCIGQVAGNGVAENENLPMEQLPGAGALALGAATQHQQDENRLMEQPPRALPFKDPHLEEANDEATVPHFSNYQEFSKLEEECNELLASAKMILEWHGRQFGENGVDQIKKITETRAPVTAINESQGYDS
ncbi:hypothetical protein CRE_03383 [Caenorhabditis remanei]|uniref:Uncharacterized protein n=2 Tax=Caenorhabditis remanei TaxID=31234 RepID=E3N656_CAERE|nr:hypothetical protein CRE_03383 [Caenorhabditis remanei]